MLGNTMSGVVVATMMRSIRGAMPAAASALCAACERRDRSSCALRRDVALADAGARDDPLVGGVDGLGKVVVGQDLRRADSCRCRRCGVASSRPLLAGCARPIAGIRSVMRWSTPLRASSHARLMATSNAKLSAEPWLLTTMPRRPSRLAPL